MPRMTVVVRCVAVLAVVFLGCNGAGGDAPPQAPKALEASTQRKALLESAAPPARLDDSSGGELASLSGHNSPVFRYGHVTWRPVGPRTAEFSVLSAFRRVYPGSGEDGLVVTGDLFLETEGGTFLCFGDGECSGTLTYEVTGYDAEKGWVTARAVTPGGLRPQPGTGVTVTEVEPNNGIDTPDTLQMGDDYSSTIEFPSDMDYVRFTLTERTTLELSTVLRTLEDSYLYLFDTEGHYLASDDDSGEGLASRISIELNAGTYYIGAAAYGASTGQQLVQLRRVAASPPGPITHTYSWDGPFTAYPLGCCRIDNLSNGQSMLSPYYHVNTVVSFTQPNSAPVTSLPHVIEAPTGTPDFTFQIPAMDADGDVLTFRLATFEESSLWPPPPGLTVSSTGLVSWSTVGTVAGQLWAVQVVIEERRGGELIGSSAVDFLLLSTGDRGAAPTCVPPSQTDYTVNAGERVQFTISAQDPDALELLTLSASGVPSSASLQPSLPRQGYSNLHTTFSWTPSPGQAGNTYVVSFTARDSSGQQGQCTVRLTVLRPSNRPPLANAGSDRSVPEGSTVTLSSSGSYDPEGGALTYRWSLVSSTGPAVVLSSPTSPGPSFRTSDDGVYTFLLTVTDPQGATGSDTVVVTVNNAVPQVTATRGDIQEGQVFTGSGSFTDPGADSWTATVDYADGTGVQPLALNNGTFTLSHRYARSGFFSVQIVITDDNGGRGLGTAGVLVRNVAPVMTSYPSSLTLDQGQFAVVPVTFTDPGADSWSAVVEYGNGTVGSVWPITGREFTVFFPYTTAPRTYSMRITLSDGDGGAHTVVIPVVIRNVAPVVTLQGGTTSEGAFYLSGATFQDPGSSSESYTATVDYGDGSPVERWTPSGSSGVPVMHTYLDDGTFLVTVTVTDNWGATGRATAQIIVNNMAPQVRLEQAPVSGPEGSSLSFRGDFYDSGRDTWTSTVDYGDGTGPQPVTLTRGSFRLSHVYANNGTYTVTLTVADDDGGVGTDTRRLTVHNVAPTVSATGGTVDEGSPFSSSGSFTDPGADRWTARVDHGDGTGWQPLALNGKSFNLNHAYANSGTYSVVIAVQDSDGAEGRATVPVTVRNVAPVVTVEGGSVDEGSAFIASGAFTDPGTESWSASVDYGDGSGWQPLSLNGTSFTLNHVYGDNGSYTVAVRITDDAGAGTGIAQVVVNNVVPVVTATGGTADEGSVLTSSVSFTDPGSRDTWVAMIDYGDGSAVETHSLTTRSFSPSHTYADNGTYLVTITVMDDDGGSTTGTVWTTVFNVAPTATASNDSPQYWGFPVGLEGTATDPSQADTRAGFTALWTLGDGTTASGLTTAHAYAAPGTYQALLTVTDKDGGSNRVPAITPVTIQQRPAAVTCQDTTAVFGFPVALGASFVDGLANGLPGGRSLSFRLGDSTGLGSATTNAAGLASVRSPGELMPGSYPITVSFAGDSHYTAAEASCTLTVTQTDGHITGGGLRFANRARGGFNVRREEGGPLQGELQFQNDTTSFHAHEMTALGLSADQRRGWFAGVGRDGRAFTAYVEDNGEPGTHDVFQLWIDGVPQTGDGAINGGNIQIH